MSYPILNDCPVCHHELQVTRLECSHCHTVIENNFSLSKWFSFSEEQMHFIETFIVCRGNIKEVEKKLGISYPTVRGKLNDIIAKMTGNQELDIKEATHQKAEQKAAILEKLEQNELTAEEAIALLKEI
ncbi:DUF2089 domain-containing protein [Niallia sp. 01092]|uniref:DUF2089 domain-containing protein n=1 Tax=unclassified Niallia TaxID=2837522 RepID=UPI003FD3B096